MNRNLRKLKKLIKKVLGLEPKRGEDPIFIDKKTILKYLPKNPVIIDCGAHVGYDSIEFTDIQKCHVHAFEPVTHLYKSLENNTKGFKDITRYKIALSDTNGTAEMYISSGYSDASSSLLKPKTVLKDFPEMHFDNTETVVCKTLDSWAEENNISRVDLLWLDMQGFEHQMLKASTKILPTVKAIHTEVSTRETYEGVSQYQEYKAFLESKGFKAMIELIPEEWDGGNVLFIRN